MQAAFLSASSLLLGLSSPDFSIRAGSQSLSWTASPRAPTVFGPSPFKVQTDWITDLLLHGAPGWGGGIST